MLPLELMRTAVLTIEKGLYGCLARFNPLEILEAQIETSTETEIRMHSRAFARSDEFAQESFRVFEDIFGRQTGGIGETHLPRFVLIVGE